ncbi:MAG: hypothetical protein V3R64_07880 [Sphingomonadales bacterium]
MMKNDFYPVSKPISRLIKTGVLDAEDIAAVISIENGVISILTNGIRATRHDLPKVSTQAGSGDARFMQFFEVRHNYYDWSDAMQAAGLAAGPVLDVILEGKPLNMVDLAWGHRKGWTRDLLKEALSLYQQVCQERGKKTSRLTA